jgi:hypothetical protein
MKTTVNREGSCKNDTHGLKASKAAVPQHTYGGAGGGGGIAPTNTRPQH